ncbi:HNH endonuclease signature motif containing protein [Mesorhizobium sp. ORM16]|uniref:HNH endonuclease signature motif containing protein n=1 Tax=Mesorhizobium sp. ORM16 TaxID=3376989 RepID=UPI003857D889
MTRAGTGHQYWSPFGPEKQERTKELGKAVYQALYEPPIDEGPVRTLDLPVAGKGYNALPFVFDLVNQVNRVSVPDGKRKSEPGLPDETDGAETIKYLESTSKLVERITGDTPGSFGLHPVVYFYSRTGAFQPSAFFAASRFIEMIIFGGKVREYLAARAPFELFLLNHKEHVSLTVHKFGAGERSVPQLVLYFQTVMAKFQNGKSDADILAKFAEDPNFQYLLPAKPPLLRGSSEDSEKKTGFNRGTKSATFIGAAIAGAPKCGLCGAMVHKNSMHIDHKQRVREGGGNEFTNAQITHPICDSMKN